MPKTGLLPYEWYETPNIHMCTILDFENLCQELEIQIIRRIPLSGVGHRMEGVLRCAFANLLAPMAVYLLQHQESP
jgi:methionine biosynthesis protein MetW